MMGDHVGGDMYHYRELQETKKIGQTIKVILTKELRQKVLKQVEFYFSDLNSATEKYSMMFLKNILNFFSYVVCAIFNGSKKNSLETIR